MTPVSSSILPSTVLVFVLVTLLALFGHCYGQLKVGFYDGKCRGNDVETLVHDIVKQKFTSNPNIVPDLVRLSFHDCFVRGCDGSIFLDGVDTEKTSPPSKDLGGLNAIEDIKTTLENACPGITSCADILVIAARAAISLAGGKWYAVETGRRDGLVSKSSEAIANIPPPTVPVAQAIKLFTQKGLNTSDLVVLLGGHTVGSAHCHSFKERLYNFRNTGKADTTISSSLLKHLHNICPENGQSDGQTFLDQTPNSQFKIDNGYYKQIRANNGTMEIDQYMALHPLTRVLVKGLADGPNRFQDQFGPAMVKMARIGVLTGNQGEIRKTCSSVNS